MKDMEINIYSGRDTGYGGGGASEWERRSSKSMREGWRSWAAIGSRRG